MNAIYRAYGLGVIMGLMWGAAPAKAWEGWQIDFPGDGDGWSLSGDSAKYTGPDGSTEWFRHVLTAPSDDSDFNFKMVTGNDWNQDYGGNTSFPKNEVAILWYQPMNDTAAKLTGGTTQNYRYIFTTKNPGLSDSYISVMELSRDQAQITGVTGGQGTFATNQTAWISIYFAANPPPEEKAFIRYTTNSWASFSMIEAAVSGQVARAAFSNLQAATAYEWYALASPASAQYLAANSGFAVDALTLTWINNNGTNYKFTTPPGSAAWVWHNHDRVVFGSTVQFWARIGYINGDGSNPWVSHAALYYTTNGVDPAGSYGVPGNGSTLVLPMALDHIENDSSPYGSAMKWLGTLTNVPLFTPVRYKIGAWLDTSHPERFADYVSGTNDLVFAFQLGTVGEPLLTVESAMNGKLNANYTTSKFFVDEVAGDAVPLTVAFDPGESNVVAVEVFSNLNRRDWADGDGNGDGIADGIVMPDGNLVTTNDTHQYYAAVPMASLGGGHYEVTLQARKTGAYRLTARWKVQGDTLWRWYSNASAGRRDHAIVVSPVDARSIALYELNPMIVEASGTAEAQRSTFEDLWDGPGATQTNRWNLDYAASLGCNWLWFQPIHPAGIEGRLTDPNTGLVYDPGSPYSVKNFFEVSEKMSKGGTRPASMAAFTNFMAAADARGLGVMLDAPFNHTAPDCELAAAGVSLLATNASSTNQIRSTAPRFYSRNGNYAMRATNVATIAVAPDRGDFGKWNDVCDVYFGRYAALVDINPDHNGNYLSESDWFDTSVGSEEASGENNGHFDAVTRSVWRYFATYVAFWLDKTGYPANPSHAVLNSRAGLDGLRCDFGQGLPPQCWEYLINVTRARKWNFVFMSESLDGGAVTYRSNRHFDILNENIVFPFKNASQTTDYRSLFEQRRAAYGQGLVLMNTTSHDEENYDDPWQAAVRMAVAGSMDGVTMVFYGQELGISRTYGFDAYQGNFGKQIVNFMTWNSMMPIWNNTNYGLDQLYPVIAGIHAARRASPALRSSNRYFLNQTGEGAPHQSLWAVAKYEEAGASPAVKDVVFAFANLNRDSGQAGTFNVNIIAGSSNLFGIKPDRSYNVKNISAYTGADAAARTRWQWGAARSGSDILAAGIYVGVNAVPTSDAGWASAPFEAQYLKLYDVTPPPSPGPPTAGSHYALGTNAVFSWAAPVPGADDALACYLVSIGTVSHGSDIASAVNVGLGTNLAFSGQFGTTNYATVWAVSSAGITSLVASSSGSLPVAGLSSSPVVLLVPEADSDGDGLSNAAEATAGTDPLNAGSVFRVTSMSTSTGGVGRVIGAATQPGRTYRIVFKDDSLPNIGGWSRFGNTNNGIGSWRETNPVPGQVFFVDDLSVETTSNAPANRTRFYRIEVE